MGLFSFLPGPYCLARTATSPWCRPQHAQVPLDGPLRSGALWRNFVTGSRGQVCVLEVIATSPHNRPQLLICGRNPPPDLSNAVAPPPTTVSRGFKKVSRPHCTSLLELAGGWSLLFKLRPFKYLSVPRRRPVSFGGSGLLRMRAASQTGSSPSGTSGTSLFGSVNPPSFRRVPDDHPGVHYPARTAAAHYCWPQRARVHF